MSCDGCLDSRKRAFVGTFSIARLLLTSFISSMRRAIHALMHDGNASRRISDRFARPFRRYALFAKALEPAALDSDRGGTV